MDDKILTHKQKVNVLGVRILRNIERGAEIFPGVFAKDIERRVLNREWEENGIEGVRLIQSQVEQG